MKHSTVLFASIISATLLLVPALLLTDTASAEPQSDIYVVQSGHDVDLSVDSDYGVVFDLGDGRVVTGSSVQTSYKSGLWRVKAVINQSEIVERWIGVYDTVPPMSAECNVEYRYGVFANKSTDLIVLDETGTAVNWLSYNQEERVVSGTPKSAGTYNVWFNNEFWRIYVANTGASAAMKVSFNATVDENTITATPAVSYDSTSRFSWSIRDFDNKLVGAYEGRNLSIDVSAGYYKLTLQQIGVSGSASYSQIVFVSGETIADDVPAEQNYISFVTGIIAILFGVIAIRYRNPSASIVAVASSIITLYMVIL